MWLNGQETFTHSAKRKPQWLSDVSLSDYYQTEKEDTSQTQIDLEAV
jgi:hypothetical protein